MVRIAAYINDEKIAGRVKSLLHAWAQEIGVDLQLVLERGVLSALNAEGCALFLVDSAGLDHKDIRYLQVMHAKHPDCGLVLLADDDRTAIDVYPCHPNALVPKPVTYSGLDAAMERCFGYCKKACAGWTCPHSTGVFGSRFTSFTMRKPPDAAVSCTAQGAGCR